VPFSVQMHNYQSHTGDPAVLVVLISARGTSTCTVDTRRTRLLFDDHGTARWFTAEALADRRERETGKPQAASKFGDLTQAEALDNVLYVVQVPLKRHRPERSFAYYLEESDCISAGPPLTFGI